MNLRSTEHTDEYLEHIVIIEEAPSLRDNTACHFFMVLSVDLETPLDEPGASVDYQFAASLRQRAQSRKSVRCLACAMGFDCAD